MEGARESREQLLERVRRAEEELRRCCEQNQVLKEEIRAKNERIEQLENHLQQSSGNTLHDFRPEEQQQDHSDDERNAQNLNPKSPTGGAPLCVATVVESLQRFLFLEARHIATAKKFVREFSNKLRELGVPVDRCFVGGIVHHPRTLPYNWKWEKKNDDGGEKAEECVVEAPVPLDIYEKLSKSNAAFARLLTGRVEEVRIRRGFDETPFDQGWFDDEHYWDYLALPMLYKGRFMGGVAWATKSSPGFSSEQLQILYAIQNEFSTVMTTHVYDIGLLYLTGLLEEEVSYRTRELAVTNQNLEEANKMIRQQSAAQLQHFAMMSHELRTPLNCVVGMSGLMLEEANQGNEKQGDLAEDNHFIDSVRMIHSAGELLGAIVDDVLDYSRLESGNVEMEIQSVANFENLLQTVVDTIQHKGNEKKVVVRACFDRLPPSVRTDGRRLQQVLFNLMGNAVKFSKTNSSIDLTVAVVDTGSSDPNSVLIRFSVRDYGRGIQKEDMSKIFEPFTQASTETERLFGGTGLGLAITSKLVKGLGGTIYAESEYGSGSEFIVEIPMCVDNRAHRLQHPNPGEKHGSNGPHTRSIDSRTTPAPPDNDRGTSGASSEDSFGGILTPNEKDLVAAHLQQPLPLSPIKVLPTAKASCTSRIVNSNDNTESPFQHLRILIAEDNIINQKVLHRNLKAIGITQVTIVDNGLKAVQISSTETFDLILMDVQMPIMDGLEACKTIVERNKTMPSCMHTQPRIIFVTAHALSNFRADAEAAGGSGFISKPFNRKTLESTFQALEWGT